MRAARAAWLAVALAGCGSSAAPPSAPSPLAAKPMPDFRRRAVGGEEIDTKAMRGKVVVVKFFADYCEPCKETLPAIQRLRQDLDDVAFIGVSEDEDAVTAQAVVSRYELTFPVVHDVAQGLSGRYRVRELPATFVAGPDGTIRWVGGPSQTEDDLRRAIEAAGP